MTTTTSSEINKHWHLVISVKNVVDPEPLTKYLKKNTNNYILAYETGETGHPHLDCFFEAKLNKKGLFPEKSDIYRRDIKKLYPEVPLEEWKNMYCKQNYLDKNPMYGYGYTLKEDSVICSTFDPFEHANFTQYYSEKKEKIEELRAAASQNYTKTKSDVYTSNKMAEDCILWTKTWFGKTKIKRGDNILEVIIEFFRSDYKKKISWNMYSKINKELLAEYVLDQIVDPVPQEIIEIQRIPNVVTLLTDNNNNPTSQHPLLQIHNQTQKQFDEHL